MLLRLRRFLSGFFVFVVVLALVVWWGSSLAINMNSTRIAQALESQLGPHFEVGPIGGDLMQGLVVTGVTAGVDPDEEREGSRGGPVIQAAKARLVADWRSLAGGPLTIRHISFEDVQIDLRRGRHGEILWPPFISRAGTAQGAAAVAMEPFTWSLVRAEIRYHFPRPDALPVAVDIPSASGRYAPGDQFQIEQCRGTIAESHWNLAGSLRLNGSQELNGIWELRDAGIWTLTQALTGGGTTGPKPLDSAAIPTGLINGKLAIGGTFRDPSLSGKIDWKEGAIRHFRVDQGELQLQWRPGLLTLKEGVVKAYGGRIAATGAIDLRQFPATYRLQAHSNEIQLGGFLEDAGFGKVGLTGSFNGSFDAEGSLADVSSFGGRGKVEATNGEMKNPLYGPGVSVPQTIRYDRLSTDLTVVRNRVYLQDTAVEGEDLALEGEGEVGFDGTLNLQATLTAPARQFASHPLYGPSITALGLENERVPMRLTVRGTLAAPEVQAEVDQAALLKGAGSSLIDKIRGFVGGLKRAGGG
ncbi:MAG TPA: AsmA-like C-terminal region-containing protein [bacterium]|nr:AsmA-like C-terminal region-containing protein [bacterium]